MSVHNVNYNHSINTDTSLEIWHLATTNKSNCMQEEINSRPNSGNALCHPVQNTVVISSATGGGGDAYVKV
jgi:hypothetical protein